MTPSKPKKDARSLTHEEFNELQTKQVIANLAQARTPPPPPKKDRDEITVARSIFDEIVEFTEETPKQKRARSGGKGRAAKLTDEEKSAIAKKAAQARWQKQ